MMKNKKSVLSIAALAVLAVMVGHMWALDTISLNFSENSTNQIFAGNQNIGPLNSNSTYWNTTDTRDSGSLGTGEKSNLINQVGANTNAKVTWRCSNLYWNRDGTGDDQNKLAVGYLDDGATSDGYGVQITFENIPYARYRVYGMIASDTNQNTAPYTLPVRNVSVNGAWVYGGDATTTATAYGSIGRNFDALGAYWTKIVPGVQTGNYWTIETAGATLNIRIMPRNGSQRGSITAVIIEEIDPFLPVNPVPAVGAEAPVNQVLSWSQLDAVAGKNVTYKVYFGTDPNTWSTNLVKTTTALPADFNFDPTPDMANSTKYFWRVDALEPNLPSPTPIVHVGENWWFTTQPLTSRIEANPVAKTVDLGATQVQMSVETLNATSWQWYYQKSLTDTATALTANPSRYTGQNSKTLTILDVQVNDEGWYYCVADNSLAQPATSAKAQLLTKRLVGWWKLDGNLTDSVKTIYADAVSFDGASVDPNFVGMGKDGAALDLLGDVDGFVTMTGSSDFYNFFPRGYTLSAWVKASERTTGAWGAYLAKQEGNPNRGFILTTNGAGQAVHTLRQSWNDLGSGVDVDNDEWHLVTGTYDADTRIGRIFVDGFQRAQSAVQTATPGTSNADVIFGGERMDPANLVAFVGQLDDVQIYSYPLDPVTIAKMYVEFNPDSEVCVSYPVHDIAGPDGEGAEFRDCIVNLYDVLPFVLDWLQCNIVPTCIE